MSNKTIDDSWQLDPRLKLQLRASFAGLLFLAMGTLNGLAVLASDVSEKTDGFSKEALAPTADRWNLESAPESVSADSLALAQSSHTYKSINEDINWQVISGGGTISGVSTNFKLSGTVGQTAVGGGSSTNFGLRHGFWQDFGGAGPCDCIPGDANGDGPINLADAVYVINYVFKGGPAPAPYAVCSGDPNVDCAVNLADAVYLINYIFKGGPPPVTCEQWRAVCGPVLHK